MADDWRERPLEELVINFDGSRAPVRESNRSPGPYPYYGASGVVDHVEDYLFDGEYLLIAEDGENLRTRTTPIAFLARGKFWVNNHAHIVRANSEADTRFLMYALSATDFSGYLTGSTLPKLNQGNMNRIPVLTPPLHDQRAIAHVLGTLDDKIDLNRQRNLTLEQIALAIFKSWFIDFDPVRAKAEGRWRPGENLPGMPADMRDLWETELSDSELGAIPKGWKVEYLEDVTEAIFSGGTPDTRIAEFWGGEYPWLSSGETRDGFITGTEKSITHQGIENSSTRLAKYGDVVVASAGQGNTRGQTSICLLDTYINQSIIALRARRDRLPSAYLFCDLSARYSELRAISDSHSIRGSLTAKTLKRLRILVPPSAILQAFDSLFILLAKRIQSTILENQRLSELRDTLLPKLLSGEVRVKGFQ